MEENDLTCPICMNIFDEYERVPRLLPDCSLTKYSLKSFS